MALKRDKLSCTENTETNMRTHIYIYAGEDYSVASTCSSNRKQVL